MEEEARGSADKAAANHAIRGASKDQIVSFYKLFSFADRLDVALMVVGTVSAAAHGLSSPIMMMILGDVIDSFGASDKSNVLDKVSEVSLKYVYFAIGIGIATFLQAACWKVTAERQGIRIRGFYLKALLRQDVAFHDTETATGEVIERMSGDTILIQDAMGRQVGKFIQFVSTNLGGLVVAFMKGWLLSLVLLTCLPATIISGSFMITTMSKMARREQLAYAEAGNVAEQTIGAIRTVASFTGEKKAIEKYNSKLVIAYKVMVQQGLAKGLGLGTTTLIVYGTYGLAVWYGSKLIMEKKYSGGEVITVIFAIVNGGISVCQTSPCLNAFASGKAAAYKIFETIKRKPNIDAYDTVGTVLEDMRGEIELKNVYFRYPSRPDVQIFAGLSLHIPSGMTASLVGQSGSGKSTVISLLERFYDPDEGEVLIDGVDLKKLQLKWIREKIALVSQEPVLFATTIRENILYGKENATEEEIKTAIELANAAKFIYKLPEGLDTLAGEHGTQLSGGQKQRIAIARAILKNPRILLLDEATSALDTESESVVQEALMRIMENRTTIVVAHRLTTIRDADIIAVVHQGKIVEKGTHTELMSYPEGAYTQLVRLQEGTNATKDSQVNEIDNNSTCFEIEKDMTRSSSHISSMRRSVSVGSPSTQRSFNYGFDISGNIVEVAQLNDKDTEKGKNVSIKRLAYLNRPELSILILGTIAAKIEGSCYAIFALSLSSSTNMFFAKPSELRKESRFWALIYLGLGFLCFVVIPVKSYLFGVAGEKLVQRIRSLTFEKVVHQEISWFDDHANSSGAVGARLSSNATQIKRLLGDSLAKLVVDMATIILALIIAFTANCILTLIILAVSPIMIIPGFLEAKFLKESSVDAKVMYEEASQVANDAVGSVRTVASFCAEKKVVDMYEKKCESPLKAEMWFGLVSGGCFGFSSFVIYSIEAFIFYIGAVLVKDGKATFGELFKVFFAFTFSVMPVVQTAFTSESSKAKESAASIFKILDRKPTIDSSRDEGMMLPTVTGHIELEHVTFRYPTRSNVEVFRDLSLTIPSGKTLALVGESGSGKSTIISLIERFYDPLSGRVTLDGIDIKELKLSWLRQQIGLVSQEPVLFNETIRTNLAYGKHGDVTEEEIIVATKVANAHNFISTLSDGYDTPVGQRGTQLSGGQKQRIAIARAILMNPKILLLDEATSALDAESERVVQDALDRVMVDRTTVIVAHRLSTIKGADIIAVVKNGVIAEKGKHDALMKISDGAYAALVTRQINVNLRLSSSLNIGI